MKKIGIIGSGTVAKALGNGFIKHRYEVMLGTRDTAKLNNWKAVVGEQALIGSFEETAKFGELIVLAVKGEAALDALKIAGAENIKGKTVIDTTNPIDSTKAPVNGVIQYFTDHTQSLMEKLQAAYADAHFVKAFNSIGNAFMVDPDFGGVKPTMFICGNEDAAKAEVKAILDQFGFETEDVGKANAANVVEQLCILWCIPGFLGKGWNHAFKLLRK